MIYGEEFFFKLFNLLQTNVLENKIKINSRNRTF